MERFRGFVVGARNQREALLCVTGGSLQRRLFRVHAASALRIAADNSAGANFVM